MKKKIGLFSSLKQPAAEPKIGPPPWGTILNALCALPSGEKIPMPFSRSSYEQMRESIKNRQDEGSKETVEFIDFVLKHKKLGNIKFAPEMN